MRAISDSDGAALCAASLLASGPPAPELTLFGPVGGCAADTAARSRRFPQYAVSKTFVEPGESPWLVPPNPLGSGQGKARVGKVRRPPQRQSCFPAGRRAASE